MKHNNNEKLKMNIICPIPVLQCLTHEGLHPFNDKHLNLTSVGKEGDSRIKEV